MTVFSKDILRYTFLKLSDYLPCQLELESVSVFMMCDVIKQFPTVDIIFITYLDL